MKKFTAKPIIASLVDTGLTLRDDGLLFKFMYDWYKSWETLPTYDEVLDEWDGSVSEVTYRDAAERLGAALPYVEYYKPLYQEEMIELHDDPTWARIDVPDDVLQLYGDEAIFQVYQDKVDWAIDRFEAKSGTNLELLGRSGRHVCVADTVDNVLRYTDLQALAKQLENSVIYQMNNLTDDDIITWPHDDSGEEDYYEFEEY